MNESSKLYVTQAEEIRDLVFRNRKFISPNAFDISPPFAWLPLIQEIFDFCEYNSYNIKVMQIKEKFGTLRFYYDVPMNKYRESLDQEIQKMCARTSDICQICGDSPAFEKSDGWISYRCEKHMDYKREPLNWDEVSEAYTRIHNEMMTGVKIAIL